MFQIQCYRMIAKNRFAPKRQTASLNFLVLQSLEEIKVCLDRLHDRVSMNLSYRKQMAFQVLGNNVRLSHEWNVEQKADEKEIERSCEIIEIRRSKDPNVDYRQSITVSEIQFSLRK